MQDRLINGQWRSGTSFAANRLYEAAVLAPQRLLVIERGIHPDWRPPSLNNDLALVLLEHPPTGPSKPWSQAPLPRLEGRTVRSLGYGVVDFERTGEGLRRQVMLSVQKVDSQHFQLSASASGGVCFGDSGGPTFHLFPDGVERLVGIHSTITLARECRVVTDTRVDVYRDFIQAWLDQRDVPRARRTACAARAARRRIRTACARRTGRATRDVQRLARIRTAPRPACGTGCAPPARAIHRTPTASSWATSVRPRSAACIGCA